LAEGNITYSPIEGANLRAGYGKNSIGENKSERINTGLSFNKFNWKFDADFSRTKTPIIWDRLWSSLSGKLWILSPIFSGRFENNRATSGFRFWETSTGLGFNPLKWLEITPGFERRRDEYYVLGALIPRSNTTGYKLVGKAGDWNLMLHRREYDALIPGESDIVSDLAAINGSVSGEIPKFNSRLRYQLTRERSEVLEPYYTFVGDGLGNYEFDEERGEYIPSAGGDYLREYRSTGEFTPAVRSESRVNFEISIGKIQNQSFIVRLLKLLAFDGLVQTDGRTRKTGSGALILDPRSMFEDTLLLVGQFAAEGSAKIGENSSSGITLRRRYTKSANRQFTSGAEFRWSDTKTVEGRSVFGASGSWRGSVESSKEVRLYPASTRQGADLSGTEFSLFWSRSAWENFQFNADAGYLSQKDNLPAIPVLIGRYSFSPGATYFFARGTIRGSIRYSRVESDSPALVLPYDMARGDYIGDNGKVDIVVNYNVAKGATLTGTYSLKSRTSLPPEHTAEAKILISF
jgi:hypothetical protein